MQSGYAMSHLKAWCYIWMGGGEKEKYIWKIEEHVMVACTTHVIVTEKVPSRRVLLVLFDLSETSHLSQCANRKCHTDRSKFDNPFLMLALQFYFYVCLRLNGSFAVEMHVLWFSNTLKFRQLELKKHATVFYPVLFQEGCGCLLRNVGNKKSWRFLVITELH